MNCKHCQAQLPEDVTLCPECGTENLPEEAEITEQTAPVEETAAVQEDVSAQQPAPKKEKTKASPGVIALAIAAVVVLAAVFAALIISGLNGGESAPAEEPSATGETVAATSPADTGLDDETCKGSYTAEDDAVAAAKDTVIARLGDAELTNGELQVFYWMEVSGFYSQYYYYASMLGIDFNQPLDTQLCSLFETPVTWQQYFLSCAINNWLNYQALGLEAENAQFRLSDTSSQMLENFPVSFAEEAKSAGYEDVSLYLYDNLGAGADLDDYVSFLNTVYYGGEYFDLRAAEIEFTDDEIKAYFEEHEEAYAANGLTKDTHTVDVRHILVFPEGATPENIRTETFSEEAWAVGKAQAEQILADWEAGDKTEGSFAAFANEHSADTGSNTNGGLYTGIALGQMVESFENWCFDESRQIGDYDIVQSELGFHIMYYSGLTYTWPETVKADMTSEATSELLTEMVEKYELDVDYPSVLIGTAGVFKPVNVPADTTEPEQTGTNLPLYILAGAGAAAVVICGVGLVLTLRKKKENKDPEL